MTTTSIPRDRLALTLIAAITWFGLILRLDGYIGVSKSIADGLVLYFGFFTILTNIFVGLVLTLPLVCGGTRVGRWFATDAKLGCATTAIVFVCIAYHILLQHLWSPQGWQWVADMTLHYVVPLMLLAYWIWRVPRQDAATLSPFAWSAYPAVYFVYVLLRGELIDMYPYHFIDAGSIGYGRTMLNAVGLLVLFVGLGWLVKGIARLRSVRAG
ncbi:MULTISPECIES: Pr6Pr family membrane protein [unclassified Duganella]|uniref:Pr6Pr family membrane protein n=1 Tax=unclassified Duganella TaxID=2636909 RepID=UPI001E413C5F|nr:MULTISPECIES: Pr6Pr family membrane protein [unclassified Duganella]